MIKRLDAHRSQELHDTSETRSVTFDGDKSNAGGPTANPFSPVVAYNEIILRPDGELRRPRDFDGEIVLYVRRGAVIDADSADSSDVIRAGVFAKIPARRDSWCALKNASSTQEAQIIEIGLSLPNRAVESRCEDRRFTTAQRRGSLCVVASSNGRRGTLQLAADLVVYSALLLPGQHVVHETSQKCRAWLQVIAGKLAVGDLVVSTGQGADVTGVLAISITAHEGAEFLLIDLESGGSQT